MNNRQHIAVVGSAVFMTIWGCADADSSGSFADGTGFGGSGNGGTGAIGGGFGGGAGVSLPTPEAGTNDAAEAGPAPASVLCGGGCLPDDEMACVGADGGPVDTSDSGSDVQTMMQVIDGGAALPPPKPNQGAGGSAGPTEPGPAFACYVRRQTGVAASVCEAAGDGIAGDPCMSSSDCRAGLGCVGAPSAGQCRPYCCLGNDSCATGDYCSERPLRDDNVANVDPLTVPVCVKANDCNLAEPFPCPSGQSCTCAAQSACTIVRDDGTTSCVTPGDGVVGENCPCAAGHVCSAATKKCLKICRLNAATSDCGSGRCQAATNFPDGFGVCVGAQADAG